MPEGPEVRVVVDQLQPAVGMRLINMKFLSGRYVRNGPPESFEAFRRTMTNYKSQVTEQNEQQEIHHTDKVLKWGCKGKFIYIKLDHGSINVKEAGMDYARSIWITLGMTGRFLNDTHPKALDARWYFEFLDTKTLKTRKVYYHDTRNFGTLKFSLSAGELEKKLSTLGIDLLDDLSEENFIELVSRQDPNLNICKFLMNQEKVAGIGNYILAEGLYKARIDPFASLSELDSSQWSKLFCALRDTARRSYESQGLTRPNGGTYSDTNGERGNFEFQLECYGQQFCANGEPVIRDTNGPHGRTIWYVENQLFVPLTTRYNKADPQVLKQNYDYSKSSGRGQVSISDTETYDDGENGVHIIEYLYDESWKSSLGDFIVSPKFKSTLDFVEDEIRNGETVYPPKEDIFSALNTTPLKQVKVVIVGQDPYHGSGQGHGLAFSVRKGIRIPPSLKNIIQEAQDDVGIRSPSHGNLENWAKQGVLLLNTVFTVRKGEANSHAKKGWEEFTDEIIRVIDSSCDHVVFLLWGSPAGKKCSSIDTSKHTIIQSSHPSPLAARKTATPFIGSRCFSKTNEALANYGLEEIDWEIK